MIKTVILSCIFFSIIGRTEAQAPAKDEYSIDLTFKKKGISIFFENNSQDTLNMSSFFVDQYSEQKYESRSYIQKEDSLIIIFFELKEISFAHEFKGEWIVDGQSREKLIPIFPEQAICLLVKNKELKKGDIAHVVLKFKEKSQIFDLKGRD